MELGTNGNDRTINMSRLTALSGLSTEPKLSQSVRAATDGLARTEICSSLTYADSGYRAQSYSATAVD